MASVRAFIAIQLPDRVKSALDSIEADFKHTFPSGNVKWVAVPSIHLTLKFLGTVEESKTDAITVAIARAVEDTPPFSLSLGAAGAFPNLKRVDVVWIGLNGDIECLCQLQQRIEQNITPLGFRPESRTFTAHLTLARLRESATGDERQKLGGLIDAAPAPAANPFQVDAVYLMKSQLMRSGPIYSEISRVGLSKQAS